MSLHKYWRVKFTTTSNGANNSIWLANVAFLDPAGLRLSDTVGGVAFADSYYDGNYTPAGAFRLTPHSGGANTGWSSTVTACPHWIGMEFTTPVDVRQVLLTTNRYYANNGNNTPVAGATFVEYSDDGTNWVQAPLSKAPTELYGVGRTYRLELEEYMPPALVTGVDWWNAVPGLTPLGAWDGKHKDRCFAYDCVGSNRLNKGWATENTDFILTAFNGDDFYPTFDTSIPLGDNTTFYMLFNGSDTAICSSTANTGIYMWHQEHGGDWWINGSGAPLNHASSTVRRGVRSPYSLATAKGSATATFFINGAQVGNPFPKSYVPPNIACIGYNDGTSYPVSQTSKIHAIAIFSGVATESQIAALDVAVKAAIAGIPITGNCMVTPTGRGNLLTPGIVGVSPVAMPPLGRKVFLPDSIQRAAGRSLPRGTSKNMYFGGLGVVKGFVKYAPGYPLRRRVRLIDEPTGIIVGETWSDEITGLYIFTGLSTERYYTAIGFDHANAYRAVIADHLRAVIPYPS